MKLFKKLNIYDEDTVTITTGDTNYSFHLMNENKLDKHKKNLCNHQWINSGLWLQGRPMYYCLKCRCTK